MKSLLVAVAIISLSAYAPISKAQDPTSVAAGTTVGVALANASGVLDDVMETAANNANYVVFNAAVQTRMLIESFRLATKDSIHDGISRIDSSQQEIFQNIQKSIFLLQQALDEPVEQARQLLEEVHQIPFDLLPWKLPSVLRSSPSVLGPSDQSEIAFTFRGLSLDEADPRLVFGDSTATRVDLKKQEATFKISSEFFQPKQSNSQFVKGNIILSVQDCALFGYFCSTREMTYEVGVLVLPSQLAEVQIAFDTKSEQRVYTDRLFQRDFGMSTGDLTHMNCITETQAPHDPSYFIDTDTIQPMNREATCKKVRIFGTTICPDGKRTIPAIRTKAGHRWSIPDKSPGGFTVRTCAQAQMHTLIKKYSGEMFVNLGWREYKKDDVITPRQEVSLDNGLMWNKIIEQALPADTNAVLVKLIYFDGTATAFSGNYSDRYVDASWNNATKQLILRTKVPNTISGIF